MESILARIAGIIQEEKEKKVLEKDKEELKKAVLDRIGCGFAAVRIAVLLNILTEANAEKGCSAIWGTNIRTSTSNAALINGSSSSHIEADIHARARWR